MKKYKTVFFCFELEMTAEITETATQRTAATIPATETQNQ